MPHFDGDDVKTLNLENKQCWYEGTAKATRWGFDLSLDNNEQAVLSEMFTVLGNRSFMRINAQGFDHAPLLKSISKRGGEANFECKERSSVKFAQISK